MNQFPETVTARSPSPTAENADTDSKGSHDRTGLGIHADVGSTSLFSITALDPQSPGDEDAQMEGPRRKSLYGITSPARKSPAKSMGRASFYDNPPPQSAESVQGYSTGSSGSRKRKGASLSSIYELEFGYPPPSKRVAQGAEHSTLGDQDQAHLSDEDMKEPEVVTPTPDDTLGKTHEELQVQIDQLMDQVTFLSKENSEIRSALSVAKKALEERESVIEEVNSRLTASHELFRETNLAKVELETENRNLREKLMEGQEHLLTTIQNLVQQNQAPIQVVGPAQDIPAVPPQAPARAAPLKKVSYDTDLSKCTKMFLDNVRLVQGKLNAADERWFLSTLGTLFQNFPNALHIRKIVGNELGIIAFLATDAPIEAITDFVKANREQLFPKDRYPKFKVKTQYQTREFRLLGFPLSRPEEDLEQVKIQLREKAREMGLTQDVILSVRANQTGTNAMILVNAKCFDQFTNVSVTIRHIVATLSPVFNVPLCFKCLGFYHTEATCRQKEDNRVYQCFHCGGNRCYYKQRDLKCLNDPYCLLCETYGHSLLHRGKCPAYSRAENDKYRHLQ